MLVSVRHIFTSDGSQVTEKLPIRSPRRQAIQRPEDPGSGLDLLVAADTPIGEVMTRTLVCVRADMLLETVREVVQRRSVTVAAVVDDADEILGLLSVDKLAGRDDFDARFARGTDVGGLVEHLAPRRRRLTARDLLEGEAYALPMDTSVAQAATLLSCRSLPAVIVVDDRHWVVGILTCEDLVRWLALQTGYVAPTPFTVGSAGSSQPRGRQGPSAPRRGGTQPG